MTISVYAGSFDPVTEGHLSVIRLATKIFAHVRVVVANNPEKSTWFTAEERVKLLTDITDRMPKVTVDQTSGMVVDYAQQIGAGFLVRGIRGATDAEFETQLAQTNRIIAPQITTVLLPAEPALSAISSSDLKRRAKAGEDLSSLCPEAVAEALVRRLAEHVA